MSNFIREAERAKGVCGAENIAEAVAALEALREPRYQNHADFEAKKLESILADHPYNMSTSRDIYLFLIDDLEKGKLCELVNILEPRRRALGFALPEPVEYLLVRMSRFCGKKREFKDLSVAEIKELVYGKNWLREDRFLLDDAPPSIYTTSGFGRNVSPVSLLAVWRGGTYVEIGGSVGASAYDVKKKVGFETCYSVDSMTISRSREIGSIVNFELKKRISMTKELRAEFEKNIFFVWGYDARTMFLNDLGLNFSSSPLVFGFHYLLQYYTDKKKIISNAISNSATKSYFVWISSDGSPSQMVFEIADSTIKNIIYV